MMKIMQNQIEKIMGTEMGLHRDLYSVIRDIGRACSGLHTIIIRGA